MYKMKLKKALPVPSCTAWVWGWSKKEWEREGIWEKEGKVSEAGKGREVKRCDEAGKGSEDRTGRTGKRGD